MEIKMEARMEKHNQESWIKITINKKYITYTSLRINALYRITVGKTAKNHVDCLDLSKSLLRIYDILKSKITLRRPTYIPTDWIISGFLPKIL